MFRLNLDMSLDYLANWAISESLEEFGSLRLAALEIDDDWGPPVSSYTKYGTGADRSRWLTQLQSIHDLRALTIAYLPLRDDDLRQLGLIEQLFSLRLDDQPNVSELGIRHLQSLQRLESLSLGSSYFGSLIGDACLAYIGELRALRGLKLKSRYSKACKISDSGLECLNGLDRLESLTLEGHAITGQGLNHLADLPALKYLHVRGNTLTDEALRSVSELPMLERIRVSGDHLTDAALGYLYDMPRLEVFAISSPLVTQQGLAELARRRPDLEIERGDTLD